MYAAVGCRTLLKERGPSPRSSRVIAPRRPMLARPEFWPEKLSRLSSEYIVFALRFRRYAQYIPYLPVAAVYQTRLTFVILRQDHPYQIFFVPAGHNQNHRHPRLGARHRGIDVLAVDLIADRGGVRLLAVGHRVVKN